MLKIYILTYTGQFVDITYFLTINMHFAMAKM